MQRNEGPVDCAEMIKYIDWCAEMIEESKTKITPYYGGMAAGAALCLARLAVEVPELRDYIEVKLHLK